MRFLRQSLTGLFLVALTLALLVYAGSLISGAIQTRLNDEPRAPQNRERVFAVDVVVAASETIAPELVAFGEIESRRSLELRAAAAGRVVELSEAFVEGGDVRAGEVLLRVDPADAQSALDRLKSDMSDAEAEVREADRGLAIVRDELVAAEDQATLRQSAFQRQKDLATRGVGTAAAVETAELAAASARQAVLSRRQALTLAEARIDQAATRLVRTQIGLAEAERRLADTTIVAPFDGSLSDVPALQGRLVSMNEKLGELIDPEALDAAFRVSTAQYARLLTEDGRLVEAPLTITLDVDGVDLTATGILTRDAAVAGAGQTGRLLFAQLEGARAFKPGDFVTVSVREPAMENLVRLPASSYDAGGTVLVLDPENRLEALPVTLIRRQGDSVLVRGRGLAGREVVVTRSPVLGAGISVRPLRGDVAEVPAAPEMLELSEERRAKLIAFVEANKRMPAEAKTRVLGLLQKPSVPAKMVNRIESRMGG